MFALETIELLLFTSLGLVLGSAANVLIVRLPAWLDKTYAGECARNDAAGTHHAIPPLPPASGPSGARSQCPHCLHTLTAIELLPLLSYCWQRGRCRHCRGVISCLYPLIECASAAWFALCWLHFQSQPALAAMWGLWGLVLLCMACIDGRSFWLPDLLTLPFLAAGLLLSMLGHGPTDGLSAGIGALVGWGTLTAVGYIFYRLTGRMGFGGGDAKLLAGLGAWLGWQLLPWVLMGAALGGVVFGLWQRGSAHVKPVARNVPDGAIPFGPFLALAAAVLAVHVWP